MFKLPIEKAGKIGMVWKKGKKGKIQKLPKNKSGFKFPTPQNIEDLNSKDLKEYKKYKNNVQPFASVAQAYFFAKNKPGLYLAKYEASKGKNISQHYVKGTESKKEFTIRSKTAIVETVAIIKKYGYDSKKAKACRRQLYAIYHYNTQKAKAALLIAMK